MLLDRGHNEHQKSCIGHIHTLHICVYISFKIPRAIIFYYASYKLAYLRMLENTKIKEQDRKAVVAIIVSY